MPIAKERHQVKSYPTPLPEDLIFYEIFDSTLPANESFVKGDSYSSIHEGSDLFPNHILVHVAPVPRDDKGMQMWFFAAKRENQDLYNFEFTDADIDGTRFPAVRRTYLTMRSEFDPSSPIMGSPMPDSPVGLFGTGSGSPSSIPEYALAKRSQTNSDNEELNSIFVADVHLYMKRSVISDVSTDPTLGVGVSKKTTIYFRGEQIGGIPIETLINDPTNAFWGLQSNGVVRNGTQITGNSFAVEETSSRDAALLAYKQIIPSKLDLRIPDELVSISVVYNKQSAAGSFNSQWDGLTTWEGSGVSANLSGSESATANAAASIQPDLSIDIRQRDGRDIPSIGCFFFMKMTNGEITDADFLARVATVSGKTIVGHWPVFKPRSHVIVLKGQKVSVSAKASASASMSCRTGGDINTFSRDKNEGSGTDIDYSTSIGTTRIPPTIHGSLTITGLNADSATASAQCDVGWTGVGSDSVTIDGVSHDVVIPSTTASAITGNIPANASIYPASLAATSPSAIPTSGWYVTNIKLDPVDSQWQRCYAEIFDASNI